jgi:hypothetical protein
LASFVWPIQGREDIDGWKNEWNSRNEEYSNSNAFTQLVFLKRLAKFIWKYFEFGSAKNK